MTIEDAVANRYEQLRRQYQPTYAATSKKNDKAWIETANRVRELDANPATYVEAQFNAASGRGYGEKFPWPNQLYSAKAVEIYKEYVDRFGASPEMMVAEQDKMLAAQLGPNSTAHDIDVALANPACGFKSWYIILMCSDAVFPRFRKVWGECALRQIVKTPVLSTLLQKKYGSRFNRFS